MTLAFTHSWCTLATLVIRRAANPTIVCTVSRQSPRHHYGTFPIHTPHRYYWHLPHDRGCRPLHFTSHTRTSASARVACCWLSCHLLLFGEFSGCTRIGLPPICCCTLRSPIYLASGAQHTVRLVWHAGLARVSAFPLACCPLSLPARCPLRSPQLQRFYWLAPRTASSLCLAHSQTRCFFRPAQH